MYIKEKARFRQDLLVKKIKNKGDERESYLIKDKTSGEQFEFGAEEFFLCESLDGKLEPDQIIDRFHKHFGFSITQEDFDNFLSQIEDLGLLEDDREPEILTITPEEPEILAAPDFVSSEVEPPTVAKPEEIDTDDEETPGKNAGISFFNPEPLFNSVASFLQPIKIFSSLFLWALIPLVVIACFTWMKNQFIIQQNLTLMTQPLSFIGSLCLHLLIVNLFTKIVRGVIATIYGAKVKDWGLFLRWGIMPRFYTRTLGLTQLNRKQLLWVYGSPLIFRLYLFVFGTFLWYWNSGSANSLTIWGIIFANLGLLSFLHAALPIRPNAPGSRLLCICLNKPPNYPKKLLKRTVKSVVTIVRNPSQGSSLSRSEIIFLLVGLLIAAVFALVITRLLLRLAVGLSSTIPNLMGRATPYVIVSLLLLVLFSSLRSRFANTISKRKQGKNKAQVNENTIASENTYTQDNLQLVINEDGVPILQPKYTAWWQRLLNLKILIIFTLIFVLALPFPYSPGGELQLLPPQEQLIQAPISGQVKRVFFNGGDGNLIQQGTVIAQMVSGDIENEILTLKEQIQEKKAQQEKEQANLNLLLAGPKSEAVAVAQAQIAVATQEVEIVRKRVEVAQQEVKAASQKLESAKVSARYSAQEAERLEGLYQQGAFALQRVEDARKEAETDRIAIAQMGSNLAARQKSLEETQQSLSARQKDLAQAQANFNLVASGASSQEIEAARQEVAAATAEVRKYQQQLNYAQQKQEGTKLVMPFDGYVVDSHLNQKVGIFLNQGDTFAAVQNNSGTLVEIEVPEYDAGEIPVGAQAQVKLLAYPNEKIVGKVLAVEPATSEELYGLVFKVLVEIPQTHKNLKPGMSGYGKVYVGEKRLIVLLTRPLLRFLHIELWSWLP